jgi:hypothetical protein
MANEIQSFAVALIAYLDARDQYKAARTAQSCSNQAEQNRMFAAQSTLVNAAHDIDVRLSQVEAKPC